MDPLAHFSILLFLNPGRGVALTLPVLAHPPQGGICLLTIGASLQPGTPGWWFLKICLEPRPHHSAVLLQGVQDVTDGVHEPRHVALTLREKLIGQGEKAHVNPNSLGCFSWISPKASRGLARLAQGLAGCRNGWPFCFGAMRFAAVHGK